MPLGYCELHHIRWWDRDNGPTDLAKCIPLCGFHHHDTHRRSLNVTTTPHGYRFTHLDGRPYGEALPGDGSPCPRDGAVIGEQLGFDLAG